MGNHMFCSPSINLSLSAFSKSAPSALVRYLGSSFFLVFLSLSLFICLISLRTTSTISYIHLTITLVHLNPVSATNKKDQKEQGASSGSLYQIKSGPS